MLRTLPTKEIKVFHSPSQVGLAYMVVGVPERKNTDIFSLGYFGGSGLGNLEFSRKIAISTFLALISGPVLLALLEKIF